MFLILYRNEILFPAFLCNLGNSSGRRENWQKILVKLACKGIFLPVLTSEESPILLVRLCRTRRCPVPNSYNLGNSSWCRVSAASGQGGTWLNH